MASNDHSEEDAFAEPPRGGAFFFDIYDGETLQRDDQGQEFPSLAAARDNAVRTLRDLVVDMLPDGDKRIVVIAMRDERGATVFRASFSFMAEWVTGATA
jgi:hypothetical protein